MRGVRRGALFGVVFLLAGCAVHPLPEDVTGRNSYQIVQKIRCEARDALARISVRALYESQHGPTIELAKRVERGELTITELFDNPRYYRQIPRWVHARFEIFALSAVALEFKFDITETNDNSVAANFRNPFTDGLFTLGLSAGKKLERENTRVFKTADTFLELYEEINPAFCASLERGGPNMIYPITGTIGIEEVFDTFIKLVDRLIDPNSPGGVEKYSDQLMFTTRFTGTATPKIELDPIPANRFRLADASATLSATRNDLHQVTIAVDMGKRVTSLAQARGLAGIAVRRSAARAKERALILLDQRKTENFFVRGGPL